ncbi:MAG: hypothetical protein JXR86_00550 [Spirochaetales bacterium]|nr:hypothetical protein [Spirochaetales bacterium]
MSKYERTEKELIKLGFTEIEAQVYLHIAENGLCNGSQIARSKGLARTSVYTALEQLYNRNVIDQVSGDSVSYVIRDPETVFPAIEREMEAASHSIQKSLKDLKVRGTPSLFRNLNNRELVDRRIRELICGAEIEIYINATSDFAVFHEDLKAATDRGVKIWLMSFETPFPLEFPITCISVNEPVNCDITRYMVVADMRAAILADGKKEQDISGTYSENPLFVSVIAEHIHHDIYLIKLQSKYGPELINDEILCGTILERE